MTPAPVKLPPIYRGCVWPAVILDWEDANGNPIDLSNFLPYAQMVNGVTLNAVKSQTTVGRTAIYMLEDQTATLKLGRYNWDWVWKQISPELKWPPFLSGEIEVLEPKTHVQSLNGAEPIFPDLP